ncbi:hypothetical protein [Alteraurantiacibacter palmitatis]|uniref:DUF4235 domain-containing protein n=1 Tax=Alteraurantiacibacter palmitatis TaxID=2054628 RepID=A0ABV7E608_9SPHN
MPAAAQDSATDPAENLASNPVLKLLLADAVIIALTRMMRSEVAHRFIARKLGILPPAKPRGKSGEHPASKPSLPARIAGVIALRIATRSVPGAALVGAGMLAHTLYKRGRAKRAGKQARD